MARTMSVVNGADDFAGCSVRQPERLLRARPRLAPLKDEYMRSIMQTRLAISWRFAGPVLIAKES